MTSKRLTPLLVGECPDHWERPFIEDVTELLTNGYVGPSSVHQTEVAETGVRYLQGFNVRPNKIDLDRTTWVTKSFHDKNKKSQLREGDLLVVQSGHIGTAAVVPAEAVGSNCHALIICRFLRDKVNPQFVSQYLNSEIGRLRLRGLEVGSSLPHINTSELGKFRLPLPPLNEQAYLAKALSLWDVCIERTERLIAAKERLQHDTMRKAFLHSHGQPCRLSDLVIRVSRKNKDGNDHPLTISGQDGLISQSHFFDKRIAADSVEHYTLIRRGEFAYNRSYSSGYPYGAIKRLDAYDEGVVSSLYLCFSLKPEAPVSSDYLAYFCEAGGFNRQIHKIAQEGARNHGLLNVATDDFFSMSLSLPPKEQQEEVVDLLTAIDRELTLLRRILGRYREQKRGLMQKLLTGEWPVPVAESEEIANA